MVHQVTIDDWFVKFKKFILRPHDEIIWNEPETELARERFAGGSSPASEHEMLFAVLPAL